MLHFDQFQEAFLKLPPLRQAGFFLWPSLHGSQLTSKEISLLKEIQPSGLTFFKRNFKGLAQGKELIEQVKTLCQKSNSSLSMPFIASIDEEGGRVSRLPVACARGQSALSFSDSNQKEALVEQILHQCFISMGMGVNCLLAPVADILTEPQNQVMGDRCFGRDAPTVSEYASLVHQVITQQGLFSCAKHFPGHGNTTTDSHKECAKSDVTLQQLKEREWLPFQNLIEQNIPFIMAAHVLLPKVDPQYPATLSYIILTEHLRKEMGFKGLILSDDLRMNAIALHYQVNKKQEASITEEVHSLHDQNDAYLMQASLDALQAGCDIILSCQSIEKEAKIAERIALELDKNPSFRARMLEKAWRIYQTLLSK